MGKGARSREQNAGKRAELKEKEAVAQKKKKKERLIIAAVSLVLVVVLAAGGLFYGLYYGNGTYLRQDVVASSANFKVDNAMMTYYFKNTFATMQSAYGGYFGAFTGVDTEKSLKNQPTSDGGNWFDSVLSSTKESVQSLLALAESAKAEGMELTEADQKSLDRQLDSLAASYFADGVSKEDVRKALEISFLAQKYSDQFEKDTQYTDADIQKYFNENKNTYQTADYRSYTLSYAESEDDTKKVFTAEEAKQKAEALKAAGSEEKFQELVKTYAKELNSEITDEDLTTAVDNTLSSGATFTEGSELSEWAFNASNKAGVTYMKEDTENKSYTVAYLVTAAHRDEAPTIDIRHVLFTTDTYGSDEKAKAKAEEVKALYEKDSTEDNFAALAGEYSEDPGSQAKGGLYTGVTQGAMLAEFDAWCFDGARKAGDVDVVKTSAGYHLMYFVGQGKAVWQEKVSSDLTQTAFNEKLTELESQYATTFVDNKLTNIPG